MVNNMILIHQTLLFIFHPLLTYIFFLNYSVSVGFYDGGSGEGFHVGGVGVGKELGFIAKIQALLGIKLRKDINIAINDTNSLFFHWIFWLS
jgi:hypothetical protein